MRHIRSLLVAAELVALATPVHAQFVIGARDSFTVRVDSIFRPFNRTDSPGCAIGVYRDGQIAYARGYGMANLELGVPITPRSVFDVASIDKMFTATAVLLLAQDGKLSLKDRVRSSAARRKPTFRPAHVPTTATRASRSQNNWSIA